MTTSLIAEGAWAAAPWIEGALNGAKFFGLHDRKNPPNALLNPYPTSDGRWLLLVIAQQDRDWPALANVIARPELLGDERFFSDVKKRSANAAALAAILDQAFSSKPLSYWKETFGTTRITMGVVQTLDEVVHDEQMLANHILVPVQGADREVSTVNSPMQVIGAEKVSPRRAPDVGEHTREVLLDSALQKRRRKPCGQAEQPHRHLILQPRCLPTLRANPFSREERRVLGETPSCARAYRDFRQAGHRVGE